MWKTGTMAEEKHSSIRRALEKNIRDGRYFERIPPVRALAREFGVSLQTMTKALRPLKQSGLLLPGPGGTRIAPTIPYRFPTGVVMLVVPSQPDCPLEQDPLLTTLRGEMARDGITPVLVVVSDLEIYRRKLFWEARQCDGYIFLYQSFYRALRHFAFDGLPCLVGNRLDSDAGVHWVDFDWKKNLFDLVRLLLERGFRKIAYLTRQLGLAAHFHYETWQDVCESYALFNYTPDKSDFMSTPEARLERFTASPNGCPEALLFHNLPLCLIQAALAAPVWRDVTVVQANHCIGSPGEHRRILVYQQNRYDLLAKEMWKIFKSIADGSAGPPRGHLLKGVPVTIAPFPRDGNDEERL